MLHIIPMCILPLAGARYVFRAWGRGREMKGESMRKRLAQVD